MGLLFAKVLVHSWHMSTGDGGPQWERLARYVHQWRTRQGLTQREVTERGGPSDTLLSLIEAGDWRPGRGVGRTLEKLDRGMGWEPGSASRTLAGGEPAEDGAESPPVDLSSVPASELAAELLRRIPNGPRHQSGKWQDQRHVPPL